MRQYCILGSLLSESTVESTLLTAASVAKAKRELMELAVEDLQLSATPDGYRNVTASVWNGRLRWMRSG